MDTETQPAQPTNKPRPGWLLMTGTVVLVLISMLIWSRNTFLDTGNSAAAIGGAASPIIWAIVTALLFSISVRFRSPRSKTKVVMWATVLFILAGIARMSDSANIAVVRAINAGCPKMLDEVTRMDGATAGPGKLITINNTTIAVDGASIDRVAWRTSIAPAIRASSINATFVRKELASGTAVAYRYTGRDGVFIDEIKLTPGDLKKK